MWVASDTRGSHTPEGSVPPGCARHAGRELRHPMVADGGRGWERGRGEVRLAEVHLSGSGLTNSGRDPVRPDVLSHDWPVSSTYFRFDTWSISEHIMCTNRNLQVNTCDAMDDATASQLSSHGTTLSSADQTSRTPNGQTQAYAFCDVHDAVGKTVHPYIDNWGRFSDAVRTRVKPEADVCETIDQSNVTNFATGALSSRHKTKTGISCRRTLLRNSTQHFKPPSFGFTKTREDNIIGHINSQIGELTACEEKFIAKVIEEAVARDCATTEPAVDANDETRVLDWARVNEAFKPRVGELGTAWVNWQVTDGSFSVNANADIKTAFSCSDPIKLGEERFAGKWIKKGLIVDGSFGKVFHALDVNTGALDVMKAEAASQGCTNETEVQVYKALESVGNVRGFPKLHYFGRTPKQNTMVLSRHGPSLHDLITAIYETFSDCTVLLLGLQAVKRLIVLHSTGHIHRDLKPENMLVGLDDPDTLYIIDYGLASRFVYDDDTHVQLGLVAGQVGTVEFSSVHANMGYEQSKTDDLVRLGYSLAYMLNGRLPWFHPTGASYSVEIIKTLNRETDIFVRRHGRAYGIL